MKSINLFTRSILFVPVIVLLMLTVLGAVSVDSYAKGAKAKGPKCKYQDLNGTKIITFNCDLFQSKGNRDSITPQIKIIDPEPGDVIDYSSLTDSNANGVVELPITIIISPESDYVVDFTNVSNPGTQYGYLPQEDGLGHLHAYIAPDINVSMNDEGEYVVEFVSAENRADRVGGFCVFTNSIVKTDDYQILQSNCELFQLEEDIVFDRDYRLIVDATESSHGPRLKSHPRAVPPGDQVIITFSNAPMPLPE